MKTSDRLISGDRAVYSAFKINQSNLFCKENLSYGYIDGGKQAKIITFTKVIIF